MMNMSLVGCVLVCILAYAAFSDGCTISAGWREMSMTERLLLADAVVYGKTKEHRAVPRKVNGQTFFTIDAVYEVFCVLKSTEEQIPEEIIIESISPRSGCSGTKGNMRINEESIVAIKQSFENRYQFHEVMPRQGASFPALKSNFFSISNVCTMQLWDAPKDARVNRCPVCGVSDFTSNIMDADDSSALAPCFINGALTGTGENCNMFLTKMPDNSTICVPGDFSDTCASMPVVAPSVTCECAVSEHRNHAKFGDIDAASVNTPGIALLFVMAASGVLSLIGNY